MNSLCLEYFLLFRQRLLLMYIVSFALFVRIHFYLFSRLGRRFGLFNLGGECQVGFDKLALLMRRTGLQSRFLGFMKFCRNSLPCIIILFHLQLDLCCYFGNLSNLTFLIDIGLLLGCFFLILKMLGSMMELCRIRSTF